MSCKTRKAKNKTLTPLFDKCIIKNKNKIYKFKQAQKEED